MASNPVLKRSDGPAVVSPEELSSAERAELLDPAAWEDALARFADGTGLAVALADAGGRLVGQCLNPQPVWKLVRASRPAADGDCVFCLNPRGSCTAAADALRTGQPAVALDGAQLAHVTVPLMLNGVGIGVLLAGQVFERFAEQLPVERVARESGASAQTLWRVARQQQPFGRNRLHLCGGMLAALGQSFLSARYGAIAERRHADQVLALSRDVTEHRRLTAEVETSRRQLALALAASGAVTWQWRPGTESLDWTPEYRALYGFTPDDPATYDRWLARIHPDDRVRLSARIQWMLETPGDDDWREEFRIHHPETGDRWLAGLGRVSRDPVGRATLVAGINFDVTDRKRAEQELVEARRFFHSIIDALSAHIAVLDENGVILAVNAAWRRFADENEFREDDYGVGSHYIREWKSSTDELVEGGLVSAGLRDVLLGRRNEFQLEYACHSLVQQRWFIMRATPFAAPHPMRVVVSHENITERKLAEEALQAADRHKGEFIAVLSHELRNPLAPIRNAVQILRRSGGTGEAAVSATDIIERQVGHLLRLVDDLLDINRISRGKFELKKERVELASVVRHAVEAARPLAASAGHELTVDLPPEPIYLDADPARIAQALGNLLTNAFKYTERGGRVWVAVKRDGGHAILRVRDTGVGLAVDQLTHIFEMFMQVDATLERSRGGLGIGLSLVKRLIEMHGGSVEAHSDGPGRGSEFTIRLPVVATPPRSVTCGSSNASAPSVARRRILVVDDNRDAADTLVMLLKLGGHEVHTAHDGLEAVEAAEKVRPHVILLDLGLPKLDGYEACRRIRQQLGSDLVLIALTGLGQEDHRLRSREAGFDAHMVKPVDYALLAKLLAEASAT